MDEQYYLTKHVALVERVWGAQGLERIEVRKVTGVDKDAITAIVRCGTLESPMNLLPSRTGPNGWARAT
jgi:hypothetical protein